MELEGDCGVPFAHAKGYSEGRGADLAQDQQTQSLGEVAKTRGTINRSTQRFVPAVYHLGLCRRRSLENFVKRPGVLLPQ